MCRGCFFVQMDSDGVDVDGCYKADIIEELRCDYEDNKTVATLLDEEEKKLDKEEMCYQGQKDAPNYCPLLSQFKDWATARDNAITQWENDLRKKVSEQSVVDENTSEVSKP